MKTRIFNCTCENEFQDKTYGPGRRVANQGNDSGNREVYRCTVCNAPHNRDKKQKEPADKPGKGTKKAEA